MKIAYFGYDPLSSCLEVFVQQGHELVVIYTGQSGPFSDKVIDFASKHSLALCFEKPKLETMQALVEQGVELFFSAEYPHKIPVPVSLKYAINAHPTLLPEGRGMTPLPHLILKSSNHAGITLHKLTNEFDAGDILLQQSINLAEDETFDSLSAKLFQQTPVLLSILLPKLDEYYKSAWLQGKGSEWPAIEKYQRTLSWQKPTAELIKIVRAFGSLGTYADINGRACVLTSAEEKCYQHHYSPAEVIANNQQNIVIATIDGHLCLSKKSLFWL